MRREAEQEDVARTRGLAHELTEVQLAPLGGVSRAGVADVRVVGPDHDAGRPAAAAGEVLVEQLQRFGHVLVAHVPRVGAAAEHRPVVGLGVVDHAGVLLRIEELVAGQPVAERQPIGGASAQLGQLLQHAALAVGPQAEGDGVAVGLRLVGQVVEAGIARAGTLRRFRIDAVEIAHDGLHRIAQAVQVEAEEADAAGRIGLLCVVRAQPAEPARDLGVAPHPAREALEIGERRVDRVRAAFALRPAARTQCRRPVGLDGDRVEAAPLDQPARQIGAQPVELFGAMRRLAEQHEARIADRIDQAVGVGKAGERTRRSADGIDVVLSGHAEIAANDMPGRAPRLD